MLKLIPSRQVHTASHLMMHPYTQDRTATRSEKVFEVSLLVEKEIQVERNAFGSFVSVALATAWFFAIICLLIAKCYEFKTKFGISGIFKGIREIPLIHSVILGLACLVLGGYHAFILLLVSKENIKKENEDWKTRLINAWPLILGTILYVISVSMIYSLNLIEKANFGANFFLFLGALNVPLTSCFVLLSGKFVWNLFDPWTVKEKKTGTSGKNEVPVPEFRVVGFLVSVGLALIWFLFSGWLLLAFWDVPKSVANEIKWYIFTCHICSLIVSLVHIHSLCMSKHDSGDYSTCGEFIKKNWLIISSCVIASAYFILIQLSFDENKKDWILLPIAAVICLSFCSCLVIFYLSAAVCNSSESCIWYFRPWNTSKKTTEEVPV